MYLRRLQQYREPGGPVIFKDETTHTKTMSQSDNTCTKQKKSVTKGQWLIIVHAGNKNGLEQNPLLTFKSAKKNWCLLQ